MEPNFKFSDHFQVIIKNLYKKYKSGDIEVEACKGVNLKIRRGTFQMILGPSGTGKTTLLNNIGGLDNPDSGEIWINVGNNKFENIANYDYNRLNLYRRNQIGIIFQFYNLIPILNALENVEIAARFSEIIDPEKKSIQILKKVGFTESMMKRYPNQLSGGEQQRVAIARALVKEPIMILADEPTGNLDSVRSIEIYELLKQLSQEFEKTFIIVTHNEKIADRFADNKVYLKDGIINNN